MAGFLFRVPFKALKGTPLKGAFSTERESSSLNPEVWALMTALKEQDEMSGELLSCLHSP